MSTRSERDQTLVIELALVGDDVGIHAGCRHDVIVSDEFADSRPRHSGYVK